MMVEFDVVVIIMWII